MAASDTAEVLLRWFVDQSSVQTAVLAQTRVLDATVAVADAANAAVLPMEALTTATSDLGQSSELITGLNTDLADTAAQAQAAVLPMEALAQAAQDAAAAQANVDPAGGGGGGIGLGGARSALRAGGFLLGSAAGGGDLRAIGQVATLAAIMGPVGVAAGIAAVALRAVTGAEQEAAKAAQDYVNALKGTSGETSADLQKRIDQEKDNQATIKGGIATLEGFGKALDAYQQTQDITTAEQEALDQQNGISLAQRAQLDKDAQASLVALNAQIYDSTQGAVGFKDGLGTMVESSGQLTGALSDGQTALKTSSDALAFLGVQLDSAATKANNLAAAEKASSDQQVKDTNLVISIEQMTKAQREDKIRLDLESLALIKRQLDSGTLYQAANDTLTAQYNDLVEEVNILSGTTNSYADQLAAEEAAKQALTDRNQNYLDAITLEVTARDQLTKTETDIAAERTKAAAAVAVVEGKAAADHIQAAQDTADQVAKIERDAGRALFTDKANRDAVAYIQVQQKEADDLTDQATALAKKNAAIDTSEHAQLLSIQTGEAQKLNVLSQTEAQEIVDVQNTQAALVALSYNHQIGMVSQTEYAWQAVESVFVTYAQRIVNFANQLFGGGFTETPGGSSTAFSNAINAAVDARIYHTITGGGASAG